MTSVLPVGSPEKGSKLKFYEAKSKSQFNDRDDAKKKKTLKKAPHTRTKTASHESVYSTEVQVSLLDPRAYAQKLATHVTKQRKSR